jgi:hypothetical protein
LSCRGRLNMIKFPTQSFSWRLQDHMVQDAVDGIMPVAGRSFYNFLDRRAAHILSAFASDTALVLAHLDCASSAALFAASGEVKIPAKSVSSPGWGDLDSNQGCPVQSREFHR